VDVRIEVLPGLEGVDAAAWNALVEPDDPFMEHGFLRLLETSESVGPRETGWVPRHLVAYDGQELVGAMPLYLKAHSYGEFIFDFGWAQAAMRAGLRYYPKLVCAVPFTPASGRRLLSHPQREREPIVLMLLEAARELVPALKASSLHVLFCREQESVLAAQAGLHARLSYQYHFDAGAMNSFEAFTAQLRNASRKQVRKERAQAQSYGLTLAMRPFAELDAQQVEAMIRFYRQTVDDKGGEAYLTADFFRGLVREPNAWVALASDGDLPVAGALFMQKGKALFGRYWGTDRELPGLHFELCYYLPMEWALGRGITHIEAGAQGEHKIKRGFLPRPCHSAHWAAHPGLNLAIQQFVQQERGYTLRDMASLAEGTPFKRESVG
jgi:predicted N-acyltransferase